MIRFPKFHIATSVVNRLHHVADNLERHAPQGILNAPPPITDPQAMGEQLETMLAQPQPDVGGVENAPNPGATAQGAPLLDTMLDQSK